VLPLARHFAALQGRRLEAGVERVLLNYAWPGNVRELKNVVERTILLAGLEETGGIHIDYIHAADIYLGAQIETYRSASRPLRQARDSTMANFERNYLFDLLTGNNGNVTRAARSAGISRRSVQRLMKKHGVSPATSSSRAATDLSHH